MTNPIFIDASPAPSTSQAVLLNADSVPRPGDVTRADRFWASDKSGINDPTAEVLEIDFATSGLVNRIAFDAVRFPQSIAIEYTTDNGQTWAPVNDFLTQSPITLTILESFPAVLPAANVISGHQHPQHDYDGHWQRYSYQIVPATMQKIRWVITRNPAGTPPVDATGSPMPYSVALQNIEVGYEIRSKDDIPRSLLEDDSKQTTQAFANSTDLFDSNLGFAKRTRYARNLSYNTDEEASLIWRSEPQPFPSAVVNFYADLRDDQGNPQVIDRIFIDPLYEGPFVNLYYSNQTSVSEFNSSRTALSSQEATLVNGTVDQTAMTMDLGTFIDPTLLTIQAVAGMFVSVDSLTSNSLSGVSVPFVPSYASINNSSSVAFDPSVPWWLGFSFTPTGLDPWRNNYDNIRHPVFSCSQFEIGYFTTTNTYETITDNSGATTSTSVINVYCYIKTEMGDFQTCLIYSDGVSNNLSEIDLVVGYTNGNLHITTQHHGQQNTVELPISTPFPGTIPSTLFIGTDVLIDRFSNPSVSALILKQEATPNLGFLSAPTDYSYVAQFPYQPELGKQNALIRFDPSLISNSAPTGLVGGPAFIFENLTWTPIPRTYAMHRGSMILPATRARFWNLEVTNLRPEINDKFIPVTRTVKTFPTSVVQVFNNSKTGHDRQSYDDFATNVQSQLAYTISYNDIPVYTGTGADAAQFSNTEVYVATDETNAQRLARLGDEWKYRQYHPDPTVPRYTTICQHNYDEQQVRQTSNVSFYCGLRNIQFQRTLAGIPQDRPIIEEDFLDASGLDTEGTWVLDTDNASVSSGSSQYAQIVSVTLPTQRPVRALQFASQQSDPKQIDIAGEFASAGYSASSLSEWSTVGDGKLLGLTETNSATDVSLLVSREYHKIFWADIPGDYPVNPTFSSQFGDGSYGAITVYDPAYAPSLVVTPGVSTTYGAINKSLSRSEYVGGVASSAVPVPNGGRLYAAARVTATSALSEPLFVQIIDSDTGAVLSETQSNVAQGKIKEWYTSVDTVNFGWQPGERYSDLVGKKTYPYFYDTFTRSNSSTLGNMVPSGQAWSSTSGNSLHISGNVATATVTGQRSEFNTVTPWGTFQITLPNLITAGGPYQLIDLGSLYLRSDGTLYDTGTSSQVGSITLTAGHAYKFVYTPSSAASGLSLDTTLFPYNLAIYDNGTLVTNIQRTRTVSATKALLGGAGQQFDDLIWTPGVSQFNIKNQILSTPEPALGDLTPTDGGRDSFTWAQPIAGLSSSDPTRYRNWIFHGTYQYAPNVYAVEAHSVADSGAPLATPTSLVATAHTASGNPISTGPTFSAEASLFSAPRLSLFYKVAAVSVDGTTAASSEVSVTAQQGGSVVLTWDAVPGATSYNIFRSTTTGTEYLVASSSTNSYTDYLTGGSSLTAPTGLSATPSTSGANNYFYKVTATNSAAGESAKSAEVSTGVVSGGAITLSWTAVSGATGYNIYRSTTTGTEVLVQSLTSPATSFYDQLTNNVGPAPTVNTTANNGTVMVADMMDTFGTMILNVTQMPAGLSASVVPLAYLNYNTSSGSVITLYGDGTISDQNGNVLATIASFNPTTGPIQIRYLPAQILSSSFKTTWGITGSDTQALVIVQGTTTKAVLHGISVWDSTWRGVGGANDGSGGYTSIQGPLWYPEGALLVPDMSSATWTQVTQADSLTYGQVENSVAPSTKNVAVRLVQKNLTEDFWFVQSVALFWDPVVWEFSPDAGTTWWRAIDVRNDPNAVVQFPPGLTDYANLKWRITSFSGGVYINHVAIRPWYQGGLAYDQQPRPTQLPLGPNLMSTDSYTRIENDPRWKGWRKPIPRWWWNAYKKS